MAKRRRAIRRLNKRVTNLETRQERQMQRLKVDVVQAVSAILGEFNIDPDEALYRKLLHHDKTSKKR